MCIRGKNWPKNKYIELHVTEIDREDSINHLSWKHWAVKVQAVTGNWAKQGCPRHQCYSGTDLDHETLPDENEN